MDANAAGGEGGVGLDGAAIAADTSPPGEQRWQWEVEMDGLAVDVVVLTNEQTVVAIRHEAPLRAGDFVVDEGKLSTTLVWLDTLGKPVRAQPLVVSGNALQYAKLAAAPDGGLIVWGTNFSGAFDAGGGTLSNGEQPVTFLVKMNANGAHVWSKAMATTGAWASAEGLAVSAQGDIAVSGFFRGGASFLGKQIQQSEANATFRSAYAGLIAANGQTATWMRSIFDVAGSPSLSALAFSGTKLVATGYLNQSSSVDGKAFSVQQAGVSDGILVGFAADGQVVSGAMFGGMNNDFPFRVGASSELVAVSAHTGAKIAFANTTFEGPLVGYIAAYAADSFAERWIRGSTSATNNLEAGGVVVDGSHHVFASGVFEGALTFGDRTLPGTATKDTFLVSLDANGNTRFLKTFANGQSPDLALAPNGDVVLLQYNSTRATVTRMAP